MQLLVYIYIYIPDSPRLAIVGLDLGLSLWTASVSAVGRVEELTKHDVKVITVYGASGATPDKPGNGTRKVEVRKR